ncbi:hypothetical protein NDU88_008659 [Pleurodeles waltl]|uniref:Uncharacterized protein n=1 Tax=Pleurodeles waltl TaxID=8319 RepID=A0AAV7QV88_PLEWA|nr:hypothetical protein NDU88_008659 [Pleurodeles waltl]
MASAGLRDPSSASDRLPLVPWLGPLKSPTALSSLARQQHPEELPGQDGGHRKAPRGLPHAEMCPWGTEGRLRRKTPRHTPFL